MALAAALSERKAEVVPFTPLGAVAAIQDQTGDTRIYYQKADGSIWQWCEKGTFTAGVPSTCNAMIIPANEVLPGTPLAVTPIVTPSYGAYAPVRLQNPSAVLWYICTPLTQSTGLQFVLLLAEQRGERVQLGPDSWL